jgi:hypothetical protein
MSKALIATALAILASLPAVADEIALEKLGASISACDDWFTLAPEHLAKLNQSASKAAVLHASSLGMKLGNDDTESTIIVLQSKFLLGLKEDNPNLIVASEKPWSDKFERSGKGFLDLMADRVKRLNAKTRFSKQPKELKIGDAVFYVADAENTLVPNAKTRQRYICGFMNDRYVYFVLSFNSEEDDDFRVMMQSVKSLHPTNQPK